MNDLRISLIQSDLHWEDSTANRAMFEEKIWEIDQPTDVIVLPEMFTTGFSMDPVELAERMGLLTVRWMRQMAEQTKAVITGSLIVEEDQQYYNRLIWMPPVGDHQVYNKRHLFRMADEQKAYAPGQERLIINYKGWNICPMICYDLRFPVWSRNRMGAERMDYDLLLYVANWPEVRIQAWNTLLRARAIENLAYVAGVNRIGNDGAGIFHNGQSAVFGPAGEVLVPGADGERIVSITLSADQLTAHRNRFPAWRDADDFRIL
ncbi:MAG: amidohydrolase [Cyclobacteriaceae bacterium]|jgi:predicted amidohydrolase|nr:amidohydrolase [Cytophagales bacterium]HNP78299.1 amidohydrolase [Cyclobacteriaceae bacterium]HQQ82061.1 amidohydrolase [Cyclobacteriaceae bacterium]